MTDSQVRAEVKHLHECVEDLKKAVAENAAVLEQVREILSSFKVAGAVAKWVAAIGAAGVAIYHGWQAITGR